jgi:hypothetical protein
LENCRTLQLRYTTHHTNQWFLLTGSLRLAANLSDSPKDLSFSALTHRTCVQQNYVGTGSRSGQIIARLAQASGGTLSVCHVHLAAKRLNVNFGFHLPKDWRLNRIL